MNRAHLSRFLMPSLVAGLVAGCSEAKTTPRELIVVGDDPTQIPLRQIPEELRLRHDEGDRYFEQTFLDAQGLGPLFIRQSCASCHQADARGPGATRKLAMVLADRITPSPDQSALLYGHTLRPQLAANAITSISIPTRDDVLVTSRLGPAVFGRGYIEAIEDAEIIRQEELQAARADEIKGRVNRVCRTSETNSDRTYHSVGKGECRLVGRFGLKARIATLDDFVADAFQVDMGLTSPLRPIELPNPDGLEDHLPGADVTEEIINLVTDYVRTLDLPRRKQTGARGSQLFAETRCAACHVPSMKTRASYPIKPLAGVDAFIYSDLLVHDMGKQLADGQVEGFATSREWRTAPLIGIRHLKSYLHDGRARTVEQAILLHDGEGSQAKGSVAAYRALTPTDRRALLDFVGSL